MIVRDKYNTIVQHNYEEPDNEKYWDRGDSCARDGIYAMCGNRMSFSVLHEYIEGCQLSRHPYDAVFSDPKLTSRDNVVQYFAGWVDDIPDFGLGVRCSAIRYASSGRVNKDWLSPSVRWMLYKISGSDMMGEHELLCCLATIDMWLSLIWNCFIKPNEEMNQFICLCIVHGGPWPSRLWTWHPDLRKNLLDYWGGWRNQPEIANAIVNKVVSSLKY